MSFTVRTEAPPLREDAEKAVVKIEAVGYKQGSKLFLHGEEYEL